VDVHDPHFVIFDDPIDKVRVATGGKHVRWFISHSPPAIGKFSDKLNGLPDRPLNILRSLLTSLVDVSENCAQVASRP
jgi:hypothetical protein